MGLIRLMWLRRLVRRNTNPIPEMQATLWKRRLSFVYGMMAWTAFGLVCHMIFTGRADWAYYYGFKTEEEKNASPALQFSKILNVDKGKIVRFSGLSKIGEQEFDNTRKEE